ncbi:hypothetical protein KY332_00585 [Candidatus Woesearchaeota archaeon]|nr:hypothetical protein [Candidatus Woesearchaeota archaeon]
MAGSFFGNLFAIFTSVKGIAGLGWFLKIFLAFIGGVFLRTVQTVLARKWKTWKFGPPIAGFLILLLMSMPFINLFLMEINFFKHFFNLSLFGLMGYFLSAMCQIYLDLFINIFKEIKEYK